MLKIFLGFFSKKERGVINKENMLLFDEKKPQKSLELFAELTDDELKGLIISREYINKIKERVNLKGQKFIWLASLEEYKNKIKPEDMDKIKKFVKEFIENNGKGIIYLEGLEYLTTYHAPEKIMEMVIDVAEIVSLSNCKLICSTEMEFWEETTQNLLKEYFNVFQ